MPTAATEHGLPPRRLACARCGVAFDCGSGGRDGGCWCNDEAYRMPVPTVADADCFCPACLRAAAASQSADHRPKIPVAGDN